MAKILIIGAGVAGLSAGIYAQLNGYQAIVCEKHFIAGGNLTAWNRGGFHIDNCIHWLTGTNPASSTYGMWETLGAIGAIEIYQGETLFTCEHDGKRIALYRDISRMKKEMLEISPEDKKEILAFIRAIEYFQGFCGIAGKNHNEKISFPEAVAAVPVLSKYYNLTTGELAKKFKHPLLKLFFKGFFGYEFSSLALVMVCAHFCADNGGIPVGSSSAMADRLAERFQSLGGELLLKKKPCKSIRKTGAPTPFPLPTEASLKPITSCSQPIPQARSASWSIFPCQRLCKKIIKIPVSFVFPHITAPMPARFPNCPLKAI